MDQIQERDASALEQAQQKIEQLEDENWKLRTWRERGEKAEKELSAASLRAEKAEQLITELWEALRSPPTREWADLVGIAKARQQRLVELDGERDAMKQERDQLKERAEKAERCVLELKARTVVTAITSELAETVQELFEGVPHSVCGMPMKKALQEAFAGKAVALTIQHAEERAEKAEKERNDAEAERDALASKVNTKEFMAKDWQEKAKIHENEAARLRGKLFALQDAFGRVPIDGLVEEVEKLKAERDEAEAQLAKERVTMAYVYSTALWYLNVAEPTTPCGKLAKEVVNALSTPLTPEQIVDQRDSFARSAAMGGPRNAVPHKTVFVDPRDHGAVSNEPFFGSEPKEVPSSGPAKPAPKVERKAYDREAVIKKLESEWGPNTVMWSSRSLVGLIERVVDAKLEAAR